MASGEATESANPQPRSVRLRGPLVKDFRSCRRGRSPQGSFEPVLGAAPIGAFIVPLVGWFAGVILLWLSELWSTKDKLIGTFLLPGGLALPVWLLLFLPATAAAEVCSATEIRPGAPIRPRGPDVITCTTDYAYFHPVLGYVVLGLAILIPIATVIYLGVRLRRQRTIAHA